jgi:hypothetical protein
MIVADRHTEEETVTNNAIEAETMSNGSFVIPGGGQRMLLLLLATQEARDIQRRAQEEAAIGAENILTQAEEANAFDPVG